MSRKVKPLKSPYSRKTLPMTIEKQVKKGNKWITVETSKELLTRSNFEKFFTGKNLKEHKRFMSNLGAKEKEEYRTTRLGNIPVKITSTSPSGDERYIRKVDVKKYERNWYMQQKRYYRDYENRLKKGHKKIEVI